MGSKIILANNGSNAESVLHFTNFFVFELNEKSSKKCFCSTFLLTPNFFDQILANFGIENPQQSKALAKITFPNSGEKVHSATNGSSSSSSRSVSVVKK
jgi:hypothetical protein